jgi:serine phosphatase RsbU (regulator of sigma subunit)
MKKPGIKESRIDEINSRLWNNRFGDSTIIAKEAAVNLKMAEKVQYARGTAYAKLIIAAAGFYQSKNEIALKNLTEAFHYFEINTNEKGYTRALLLKGNIFESFGDYEKTLSLWLEAYKISKESDDIESEGESCSQLGLIYARLCNFQKAIEFFNKGLKIREDLGDENAAASSLNRIGMVLRQTKKYEESLKYYFRSLDIRQRNSQVSAIPWTQLGIANTYEEMEKYSESLDFYESGLTNGDKRCTLQCLLGSGRVNSFLGNREKAETRLLESLKMAQELRSFALIADAQSALASHYELYKQPGKALTSFKHYLKTKEAFHSTEIQNKLSNIEIANAIEKSEQEKEIFRLRHVELKEAYDIIEEKNKDITASINYASRIQRAMLPDPKEIRGLTGTSFVLYLPKDIVSGDFYWFTKSDNKLIIVAGDCTGHGVPGALMSMLGISSLEEIVNRRNITDSAEILDELRTEIQRALHQRGKTEGTKDGMDIALCVIDKKKKSIQYSGAYNNLYLIRNSELIEYRADRMPIGIYEHANNNFTRHDIATEEGDIIYMFSDGYADQFGGPDNKKYKYSTLKESLMKIHKLPLQKQKEKLEKEFLKWKGDNSQVDDVIIIGLKI